MISIRTGFLSVLGGNIENSWNFHHRREQCITRSIFVGERNATSIPSNGINVSHPKINADGGYVVARQESAVPESRQKAGFPHTAVPQ